MLRLRLRVRHLVHRTHLTEHRVVTCISFKSTVTVNYHIAVRGGPRIDNPHSHPPRTLLLIQPLRGSSTHQLILHRIHLHIILTQHHHCMATHLAPPPFSIRLLTVSTWVKLHICNHHWHIRLQLSMTLYQYDRLNLTEIPRMDRLPTRLQTG